MTLAELKAATLKLIEEYNDDADELTDDEDIATKMNSCINSVLHELARFKKIPAMVTKTITDETLNLNLTTLDNFYQLNIIRGLAYDRIETLVTFEKPGTANIYYYKYPDAIDDDTDEDEVLDLDEDALNIAPYGIAASLLMVDPSNNYGTNFYNKYLEMIKALDSRQAMPSVTIGDSYEFL